MKCRDCLHAVMCVEYAKLHGIENIQELLEHEGSDVCTHVMKASDVVEVVRCRDCKHFHRAILECVDGNPSDWGICDCEWFNSEDYDVTENDFCSYGERRNDG